MLVAAVADISGINGASPLTSGVKLGILLGSLVIAGIPLMIEFFRGRNNRNNAVKKTNTSKKELA